MEKLYTDKEYSKKVLEARETNETVYIYEHLVDYEAEVLEWDTEEQEVTRQKVDEDGNPMYDKDGNPIMETVIIEVKVPRMVEEQVERQKVDEDGNPMYDEDGNPTMETVTIEVQAHHTETFQKMVAELVIADYNYYICSHDNYTDGTVNPNYEKEKEEAERNRIDSLFLTPSDVERALYYSDLHMDFDDLKALIAQQLPSQIDLKGLAIEFRANNFYRGAKDINGNRIVDAIGLILGYNSDDMDYLFINKKLPDKE